MHEIKLRLLGIETHNSFKIGELCFEPFRRGCCIIHFSHPTRPPACILLVDDQAMNDTITENKSVQSSHVFEVLARLPIISTDLPNQIEIIDAIKTAQAKHISMVAEKRVLKALSKRYSACC